MLSERTILLLVMVLTLSPCSRAAPYAPSECCFKHAKRALRLDNLADAYPTPRECYSPAIVFQTKKGDKVCANPKDKWVKRAVAELRRKKGVGAP